MTAPIKYEFSDEGVEQALTALGTSANAVATNLSALGFRGCKGSESNCPIAAYLVASIDGAVSAEVYVDKFRKPDETEGNAVVTGAGAQLPVRGAWLPEPVEEFVNQFDRGDYPDLIEEEAA